MSNPGSTNIGDGQSADVVIVGAGVAGRIWGDRPADERRQAVLAELARFFGPQAVHPTDFVEKNWSEDTWSGGCYAGVIGPGVMTDFGPALREPCGRIHWAGTETAIDWTGYIDGAIESGRRTVQEVAGRLGK